MVAGVERIVYLSFVGAAPEATFAFAHDHWWTEEHVRVTSVRHTFSRDHLYQDMLPALVGEDGVIRGPAGDGRVGAVACDDIADVTVAVMLSDEHDGQTYDVTGPEAVTLHQVADELSRVTGRSITYHAETLDEAYASRASYGAPGWEAKGWVSSYLAIATGEMDAVSDTVNELTGHAPMAFADFLRKHPESYRHLLNSR